jgi:hypothetical protein
MTRMFLTLILIFASPLVFADVLLIEQVRQAGNLVVPVNGQTKSEVESQFGAAKEKLAAVGDPPISQWKYERWSVYFEYDLVLFTVLNKGEVIEKGSDSQ